MFFLMFLILTALYYSIAERLTRDSFVITKRGGCTFFRIGRISGSYCIRKAAA